MAFVKIDDVELFFTDEGKGTPVLFVHGWACDSNDWIWQIASFMSNHRVIAVDLRGHDVFLPPLRTAIPPGPLPPTWSNYCLC